jgi:hypothetical protein
MFKFSILQTTHPHTKTQHPTHPTTPHTHACAHTHTHTHTHNMHEYSSFNFHYFLRMLIHHMTFRTKLPLLFHASHCIWHVRSSQQRVLSDICRLCRLLSSGGRAMTQVTGLSLQRPRFNPRSLHMGFVMDKVTLGQVSLQVLGFIFVNIIPPMLHTHLHLNATLITRTSRQSLVTFKQSNDLWDIKRHWTEN